MGALSIRAMRNPVGARSQDDGDDGRGRAGARRGDDDEAAVRSDAAGPMARRRRRARYLIARAASDLVAERVRAGGPAALEALADEVLSGAIGPAEAARRLLGS